MSTHVELQEAVVAALNEANLEFPITAQTSDEAYYDLESVTDNMLVNVVRGGRTTSPITRGRMNQIDYALHVGAMKRWEGLTNDQLKTKFNECDAFLDQMWKYLLNQRFGTTQATPFAIEMVAPYSVDHRERLRQFTAEFIITLRTFER